MPRSPGRRAALRIGAEKGRFAGSLRPLTCRANVCCRAVSMSSVTGTVSRTLEVAAPPTWSVLRIVQTSAGRLSGDVDEALIEIAPPPGFIWLNGAHNRMPGGPEVGGRMSAYPGIAAPHIATYHAQPQFDPVDALPQASLADVLVGGSNANRQRVVTCAEGGCPGLQRG